MSREHQGGPVIVLSRTGPETAAGRRLGGWRWGRGGGLRFGLFKPSLNSRSVCVCVCAGTQRCHRSPPPALTECSCACSLRDLLVGEEGRRSVHHCWIRCCLLSHMAESNRPSHHHHHPVFLFFPLLPPLAHVIRVPVCN